MSDKRRHHRKELNTVLDILQDKRGNAVIRELFDDLQKQRNLYRDQLTIERGRHKKLKDKVRGIVRDVDYGLSYVMTRSRMLPAFELHLDIPAGRFCVLTVGEPLVGGRELVGSYAEPYDKKLIEGDMQAAIDEFLTETAQ